MNKKTVRDIRLKGKRVLMRVDFNVPMADGVVTDDKRIRAALPTIQYVLAQGASVILMVTWAGLRAAARRSSASRLASEALGKLLGKDVRMAPAVIGGGRGASRNHQAGDVMMLENTRFEGEEKNDLELAQPGKLGDVYVNGAFGSARRTPPPRALCATCPQCPAS